MIEDHEVVAALSVFLLARIAEREAVAKLATGRIYVCDDGHIEIPWEQWDDGSDRLPNHHTSWWSVYDPARVLAECAAQRAIIEGDYWERNDGYVGIEVIGDVFRFLALPDADHEDYREEWKPWT